VNDAGATKRPDNTGIINTKRPGNGQKYENGQGRIACRCRPVARNRRNLPSPPVGSERAIRQAVRR